MYGSIIMEHELIIENDADKHCTIMVSDVFFNRRIDRLIACKEVADCLLHGITENINSITDHKGTLCVSWRSAPSLKEKTAIEKSWETLNECHVIHDLYGEEI